MKSYSELTLADDFMFTQVMLHENVSRMFPEELLGTKIKRIKYCDKQKDISDRYGFHGVRMDVYLAEEKINGID